MTYGLIGEHLTHSYSCEIHRKLADYTYELLELPPEAVGPYMLSGDFSAINVTIPYKKTVIPYLNHISQRAEQVGAVNTVVRREDGLYGYNTDFAGMEALIQHVGLDLAGRKVLILGSGGTCATAMAVARHLGAREVYILSRHPEPETGAITYEEAKRTQSDAQIIINTTPVGMYPRVEGKPLDIADYPALEGVLDAIYHPLRTNLILDAAERGIPAAGGLYMLVAQAVYASALFLGQKPKEEDIDRVFSAMTKEKQNLVLIGMPSAGKTAVGTRLSQRTGRPFIDTDQRLAELAGMPTAAYLAQKGERAFRDLESQVVREAALRDGSIIATGGGAILREENLRALRQNGELLFLDRALENLQPTEDRPLSCNREALAALYQERYSRYLAAADIRVDANQSVEQVAECILQQEGMV
jgi:shikimate dehydrogenase